MRRMLGVDWGQGIWWFNLCPIFSMQKVQAIVTKLIWIHITMQIRDISTLVAFQRDFPQIDKASSNKDGLKNWQTLIWVG